ncbi:hypothetical protein AN958_09749 [Leucoagaricus sp. SymC.cos]|nr:hypothetical protein AN958_09749 [Leucoagaricus sp. SymC.cos]
MQVTPFHLHERPPRDLGELTLTFKRYQPTGSLQTGKQQVALVFTHCVNTHKETWEPVIQHLFALQTEASTPVQIVEVWSMDSPNHGEGGVVNHQPLLKRTQGITGFDWARGVDVLYRSGLIEPPKVIGIGHSAGGCIMILVASLYSLMEIPYCSLILVEPPMFKESKSNATTGRSEKMHMPGSGNAFHGKCGTKTLLTFSSAAETQDAIVDPKQGRIMKSVVKIEGAGHQLPQEKPFEVAKFIWDSIINDLNSTAPKLKNNL